MPRRSRSTRALALATAAGLGLLCASPAWAQTSAQAGVWADYTPGLGLGGSPFKATFGQRLSAGYWRGNYDHGYLLGRAWGFGLAGRVDLFAPDPRGSLAFELRRTVDLLVVGYRWRVLVGPEFSGDAVGAGARLGGTLKYRPTRNFGPTLDAEAGAAWVDGRVSPRFSIGIGFEAAFSLKGKEKRDPTGAN